MNALRFNGREIRNALQTAVALAETEALEDGVQTVTVNENHLRAVARVGCSFKDFLKSKKKAGGVSDNTVVAAVSDSESGEEDDDVDPVSETEGVFSCAVLN